MNVIPLTKVGLRGAQIFTYLLPLNLHDLIRPGQLVKIPFGRRNIYGITTSYEMHRLAAETGKLKTILELAEQTPVFSGTSLKLADWLAAYYVCSLGLAAKAMLFLPVKKPTPPSMVGFEKFNPDFILTEYQRKAVSQISAGLGRASQFLLHGVTGSGKTEVYMQVIERLLESGKQVLMLVPEITLTDPAVERFARRFGIEKIGLLHSKLKKNERAWMWQKIADGQKQIIIGPRSAVFAPFRNLGLIVMDEEHDSSFKQYDQNPKYHARTVAKKLAEFWECPLILGDATPSVETYHEAMNGKITLLELPHRIKADLGMPKVQIVDMRKEREHTGEVFFSEFLKLEILENLRAKRQIILFVNRRGAGGTVLCRDCGFAPRCASCEVSLVWHPDRKKLVCHHCGRTYPFPELCPACGGHRLKVYGLGTQTVEEALVNFLHREFGGKALPGILRLDSDSAKVGQEPSEVYRAWAQGRAQILIGTQLVSKGWDIGQVGLVGIISADTMLHLPDFRSNERTFQILTQVAGRTGRGRYPGSVVLQTYLPENYAIEAAKNHDYQRFYRAELEQRKKFNYPPFSQLVKLTFSDRAEISARKKAEEAKATLLAKNLPGLQMAGPVPAFVERRKSRYYWHLVLKSPLEQTEALRAVLRIIGSAAEIDIDPEDLL